MRNYKFFSAGRKKSVLVRVCPDFAKMLDEIREEAQFYNKRRMNTKDASEVILTLIRGKRKRTDYEEPFMNL